MRIKFGIKKGKWFGAYHKGKGVSTLITSSSGTFWFVVKNMIKYLPYAIKYKK